MVNNNSAKYLPTRNAEVTTFISGNDKIPHARDLAAAKAESIKAADRLEELLPKVMKAMGRYRGDDGRGHNLHLW